MNKYFKFQLNRDPLNKIQAKLLKDKSLYTNCQEGDYLLHFFNYKQVKKVIYLSLESIVERDLKLFKKEYKFLEMRSNIPVFTKIKDDKNEKRKMDKT